ncbi:MAG: SpoIID/LytB domain-containing protein [Spirochaetota bacterium]|nr:SpoIID/LytB domain-containing protein [Spirochaetota bacterium]
MIIKMDVINFSIIEKYFYFKIFFFLCIIIFSCTPPHEFLLKKTKSKSVDKRYVRILLKKVNGRVLVSSKSRIRVMEIRSRSIKYDGAGKEIFFYNEKIKSPLVIESWDAPLSIDNRSYRGMIELHNILGKIYVINVVKIGEYLYGVVPSEIPGSWEIESIKAQAVAARTYTYYHLMKTRDAVYDLDATTNFQVYSGISVENNRITRAIDDTSGEIVVYKNKPILAFFHSTCGGRTIDDKLVWNGDDNIYLKGVKCNFCSDSPHFRWEEKITLYDMWSRLKKKYKGIGKIFGITLKRKSDRVVTVIIRHKNGILNISGNNFRMLFPRNSIKSLRFRAVKKGKGMVLKGQGWGHGVGMCQWGARGMALKGAGYKDILKYYYKGISIININRLKYVR